MSPEQARGENIDGQIRHLFARRRVLFHGHAAESHFPPTDLPILFNQIQNADPPPLLETDVPPNWRR